MSRLRRLKENRRKNTIKTTMASLALVLAIGSTQVIGTYALFTDSENLPDKIALSTGDVDVELNGGFNKTDIKPGDVIEDTITITNYGTLRQSLSLKLEEDVEIKNYLTYSINFDGHLVKPIKDLQNVEQKLLLNDGTDNLFILNPGDSIKANVTVTIGEIPKEVQDKISGEVKNLYLDVLAKQINYNDSVTEGFYDIERQKNTITFGKESGVISWENGLKYAGNGSDNDFITINFNDYYPDMGKFDEYRNIKILEAKGQFEKDIARVIRDNGNTFTIELNKDTDPSKFSKEFNGQDVIVLQFNYSNGKYIKVHFDFRENPTASGNKRVEAKYTIIETGELQNKQEIKELSESELVELQKEEVVAPNEPEIVEPPKEEVVAPNEPEIVEPPKEEVVAPNEPGVVELPNEEVVAPSQLDIIALPKEEIEIQE